MLRYRAQRLSSLAIVSVDRGAIIKLCHLPAARRIIRSLLKGGLAHISGVVYPKKP